MRRRAGRRRGGGADGEYPAVRATSGMARTVHMVTSRAARDLRGDETIHPCRIRRRRASRGARDASSRSETRGGDARGATRNCRVGVVGTDDAARSGPRTLADATDIVDVRERRRHPGHRSRDVEPPWITVAPEERGDVAVDVSAIPDTDGKAHESSDELESAEDDDDPSRISVAGDEVKFSASRRVSPFFARLPRAPVRR